MQFALGIFVYLLQLQLQVQFAVLTRGSRSKLQNRPVVPTQISLNEEVSLSSNRIQLK